jgi:colanic acid biosynthesis glycosyl transferase WcaI
LHNVVSSRGVVVPPENVDALAAAIESLVANPEQRAALGAEGRVFAELHLSPAWVLGRLDDKLRTLRGERAGVRTVERKDVKTGNSGVAAPKASAAVKLVEIEKID